MSGESKNYNVGAFVDASHLRATVARSSELLVSSYHHLFCHRYRPVPTEGAWTAGVEYTFQETKHFNVSATGGAIGGNSLLYRILVSREVMVLKMMISVAGHAVSPGISSNTPQNLTYFEKEASIPSMLAPHRNIIHVIHSWSGGYPAPLLEDIKASTNVPLTRETSFFVIPNMQCDLSEYRRRLFADRTILPDDMRTYCMVVDLLAAVAHMEQRRVVHRDIKPANILVEMTGALVLGDFGTGARLVTSDGKDITLEMNPEWLAGTNGFNPPEVERSRGGGGGVASPPL